MSGAFILKFFSWKTIKDCYFSFIAMVKKREVVVQNLKELIVKIELVTAALESDDFKNFTQTTRCENL